MVIMVSLGDAMKEAKKHIKNKMALKDWKKVGKDKWRKGINFISIDEVFVSVIGERKEFRVSRGYREVEDHANYFKTKSQALSFAKAYMRKN